MIRHGESLAGRIKFVQRKNDQWAGRDCGGSIESCPYCGGWLDMKMGKFGRFLGCSNFPDCRYTRKRQRPRNGPGKPPKGPGTGLRTQY
ncbi:MAG: topoisomerase DNA-binding C4 zinc finger domain-containing protein [Albidovulum sp.]|nr:topoisomerase DNA-binding C4 zinc finger domain-containing protein [Albidovulum sp.]